MAEEIKKILTIETGRSFDSIRDLRTEIRELNRVVETGTKLIQDENGELQEVRVTAAEYDKAVKSLAEDKRTLAEVTRLNNNAWDAEADAVARSQKSYAQLQAEMRRLRVAWRNTASDADRKAIAAEINDINDRLKEMDAETGNYQRNVGDYFNAIQKGVKGVVADLPSFVGPARKSIDNLGKSMSLLSKNPLIGILTLLFPLLSKVAAELKENETAVGAINKAMSALQPVFDAVTKVVETLAGWIAKAVDWFVSLFEGSRDTFKNIVAGAVGVGNALLQFLLTPIRTIIDAFKGLGNIIRDVFTGDFKKVKEDAKAAADGISDAFKKGFDFKANFAKGKEAGEAFVAGLGSGSKKKAAEAGSAAGKEFVDAWEKELDEIEDATDRALDASLAEMEKKQADRQKLIQDRAKRRLDEIKREEEVSTRTNQIMIEDADALAEAQYEAQLRANEKRLEALRTFAAQALEAGDVSSYLEMQQQAADLEVDIELDKAQREKEIRAKDLADAEKNAAAKKALQQSYVQAVGGLLDGLAELLESSTEGDEKNTRAAKALRIASATIDTLQGAITAYSAAQSLGPVAGPIVGGANATAVTAMGLANIAKIRATNVSKNGSSAPSMSAAVVSAPPAVVNEVPVMRTLTGAAEEERLNQAQDTRVVLVMSELEAKQGDINAKKVETTF